jgi:hypothetical protein
MLLAFKALAFLVVSFLLMAADTLIWPAGWIWLIMGAGWIFLGIGLLGPSARLASALV